MLPLVTEDDVGSWGSPVAVLVGDRTFQRYAVGSPSALTVVDTSKGVDTVRSIEGRLRPRWVLWSADPALRRLVAAGTRPARRAAVSAWASAAVGVSSSRRATITRCCATPVALSALRVRSCSRTERSSSFPVTPSAIAGSGSRGDLGARRGPPRPPERSPPLPALSPRDAPEDRSPGLDPRLAPRVALPDRIVLRLPPPAAPADLRDAASGTPLEPEPVPRALPPLVRARSPPDAASGRRGRRPASPAPRLRALSFVTFLTWSSRRTSGRRCAGQS